METHFEEKLPFDTHSKIVSAKFSDFEDIQVFHEKTTSDSTHFFECSVKSHHFSRVVRQIYYILLLIKLSSER